MLRSGKAILCPSFFFSFVLFLFLIENISKKDRTWIDEQNELEGQAQEKFLMTAAAGGPERSLVCGEELIGTLDKRAPTRTVCLPWKSVLDRFAGVRVLYVSRGDNTATESSRDARRCLPTTLPRPSGVSRSPAATAARDVLFG